jgi:hypothetical protein
MTVSWPNGLAHLIRKALLKKFRPCDAMSELEFSEAVMKMKLEPGSDPTEIFSQLADLENQFGVHAYPQQQVVAAIMRLVPADYRATVAADMRRLGRVLTLEEVEDCIQEYHRRVYSTVNAVKSTKISPSSPEITLSAAASAPRGACWTCGKTGHQKKDCPRRGSKPGY